MDIFYSCLRSALTFDIHSQHTNTHRPNSKREGQHLAHVTVASFSCSRHGTRAALTDTVQSRAYPGSTPGLNPCNHLAWLACGPWRTHKHNTYDHIAWLHTRRVPLGLRADALSCSFVFAWPPGLAAGKAAARARRLGVPESPKSEICMDKSSKWSLPVILVTCSCENSRSLRL